jgi:hypothetical protein
MPTPQQMETLARGAFPAPGPADDLPEAYCDSIIRDPHRQIRTGVPIQQRRHPFRARCCALVACRRCDRTRIGFRHARAVTAAS